MSEHKTIHEAMAAAFGEMPDVELDGVNPHFKSRYATLGNIVRTIRGTMAKHGLFVRQAVTENESGCPGITTEIVHKTGEAIQFGTVYIPGCKPDAHGRGSALTYARRYGLAIALGIVDAADDDGNASLGSGDNKPARREVKQPATIGSRAYLAAVQERSGITADADIKALANSILKKLGIDKAGAKVEDWKRAIEAVNKADDLIKWVSAKDAE